MSQPVSNPTGRVSKYATGSTPTPVPKPNPEPSYSAEDFMADTNLEDTSDERSSSTDIVNEKEIDIDEDVMIGIDTASYEEQLRMEEEKKEQQLLLLIQEEARKRKADESTSTSSKPVNMYKRPRPSLNASISTILATFDVSSQPLSQVPVSQLLTNTQTVPSQIIQRIASLEPDSVEDLYPDHVETLAELVDMQPQSQQHTHTHTQQTPKPKPVIITPTPTPTATATPVRAVPAVRVSALRTPMTPVAPIAPVSLLYDFKPLTPASLTHRHTNHTTRTPEPVEPLCAEELLCLVTPRNPNPPSQTQDRFAQYTLNPYQTYMRNPYLLPSSQIGGDFIEVSTESATQTSRKYILLESEKDKTIRLEMKKEHCRRDAESVCGLGVQLLDRPIESLVAEAILSSHEEPEVLPCGVGEQLLLVDKYAPNGYTDLLSDERSNRELLQWVHAWNHRVFTQPKTKLLIAPKLKSHTPATTSSNTTVANSEGPEQKLILISGPPGAGKTTMANVIAKHCGYRVLEINASDDRSYEAMSSKISAAIETTSVIGSTKPNLLVIDEIDGAMGGDSGDSMGGPQSAVGYLIDLVKQAKLWAKAKDDQDEDEDQDKPKTKKRQGKPILRPIICICNDHLAPCLRPLLPHVKLLVVDSIASSSLTPRLSWICKTEGIKVDNRTLESLAGIVNGDVRSALHTLQFLRAYQQQITARRKALLEEDPDSATGLNMRLSLSLDEIAAMSLGAKDTAKSNMEMWMKVLHKPSAKTPATKGKQFDFFGDFPRVLADHNMTDKVLEGVHHNFLASISSDPDLSRMCGATEWLCAYDSWQSSRTGSDLYAFAAYLPFPLVAIRHIVATERKPTIEIPKFASSMRQTQTRNRDMYQVFMGPGNALFKQQVSVRECALYVVSYILDLIAPRFKNSAFHLLSKDEQTVATALVSLMADVGLTFSRVQVTPPSSQWTKDRTPMWRWRVEPDVESLVTYNYSRELQDFGVSVFGSGGNLVNGIPRYGRDRFKMQHTPVVVPGPQQRTHLPDNLMENLTREVEFEQVRRVEKSTSIRSSGSGKEKKYEAEVMEELIAINETAVEELTHTRTHKDEEKDKAMEREKEEAKIKIPGMRGFLVQHKKPKTSSSTSDQPTEEGIKPLRTNVHASRAMLPLHFLFMEGFSNAVKRPVPMNNFL